MLSDAQMKEPAQIPVLTQAGPVELGLMTRFEAQRCAVNKVVLFM
jgi:hypothetical protein